MLRSFFCVVWLVVMLAPLSSFAKEVVYDRILVKINDDIITLYDLEEEMKPIYTKIKGKTLSASQKEQLEKLRKQTLDKMVNDKLMAQEIKKYQIDIPDKVIDDEIANIKEERGLSDEQFAEMVKGDGLTVEEFRTKLKSVIEKQELLGYMVHSKVLVTDSEIQKEYEARQDDYRLEKMVELSIILLPPDVAALEVKKRIEDGEMTFAQAASKFSIGPGKDKGGSIGELNWGDLADDWKTSIEGIPAGGVGTPITVQGKEALLSPIKIVENRLVPLEEVKDDISNKLMQKKRDVVFDDYFNKLKQSSVIIYMDQLVCSKRSSMMNFEELGMTLQREREKKGLSIEVVMEATKISRTNLMALESGDQSALPHPVYAKGFVKSYARFLGLDADEMCMVVDREFQDHDDGLDEHSYEVSPAAERAFHEKDGPDARTRKGLWPLLLVLVVVLCIVIVVFFGLKGKDTTEVSKSDIVIEKTETATSGDGVDQEKVVADESDKADSSVKEGDAGVAPSDPPDAAAGTADKAGIKDEADPELSATTKVEAESSMVDEKAVTTSEKQKYDHILIIRATTEKGCWVGVWKEGEAKMARDFVFKQGEPLRLMFNYARRIRIGNASGVVVSYNGKPYPLDLTHGNIQTLRFGSEQGDCPPLTPRSMAVSSTEKALVLKVGRFREADCWVRLLTPSRGVFNGFAFGGSRSRRRFVGCLDPLSHVLFTIGSSKRGEYIVLEEGSLLHNFPNIRGDSGKTGVAVNCVKFIEAMEVDPDDSASAYMLLLESLEMLDCSDGNIDFVPWLFRAKFAFDMGYQPDFLSCGDCGKSVRVESGYQFGIEKGQVACPTCLSAGKPLEGLARPISSGALRALDWIQHSRPADWAKVAMDREVRRQCSQLIELFVAYHLGLSWENGVYKKV